MKFKIEDERKDNLIEVWNRGEREYSGEVFEWITAHSLDGVYLPQGFTEKFSVAAGREVELTDNQ